MTWQRPLMTRTTVDVRLSYRIRLAVGTPQQQLSLNERATPNSDEADMLNHSTDSRTRPARQAFLRAQRSICVENGFVHHEALRMAALTLDPT